LRADASNVNGETVSGGQVASFVDRLADGGDFSILLNVMASWKACP
jgi:hypothetical protein